MTLDEQVAAEVMGVSKHLFKPDPDTGTRAIAAPYSSDIAAAWTVVEKLRERGWVIDVRADPCADSLPYLCEVWDDWNGSSIRMSAPTAPEAICRAALEAVRA